MGPDCTGLIMRILLPRVAFIQFESKSRANRDHNQGTYLQQHHLEASSHVLHPQLKPSFGAHDLRTGWPVISQPATKSWEGGDYNERMNEKKREFEPHASTHHPTHGWVVVRRMKKNMCNKFLRFNWDNFKAFLPIMWSNQIMILCSVRRLLVWLLIRCPQGRRVMWWRCCLCRSDRWLFCWWALRGWEGREVPA